MSSPTPIAIKNSLGNNMVDEVSGSLDVSWMLHSKKDHGQKNSHLAPPKIDSDAHPPIVPNAELTPPQSPTDKQDTSRDTSLITPLGEQKNGVPTRQEATSTDPKASLAAASPPSVELPKQSTPVRPSLGRPQSQDENKSPAAKGVVNNQKNQGGDRRKSWISSFSSKFSSSNSPTPRSSSVETVSNITPQGPKSPKVEFANPFNKVEPKAQDPKKSKKDEKIVITHTSPQPRRQSVLVHAGQETKLDSPGFLSSALRRLSSSNNVHLGKGAGSGAIGVRRTMNIDHNRERVKINEFDLSNLRRVAFCVDVEIAGYAVQAEEEEDGGIKAKQYPAGAQRQSLASLERSANQKKAKLKDKGEGAALKNQKTGAEEKEPPGETKAETQAAVEVKKDSPPKSEPAAVKEGETQTEPQEIPTTRKKEKKKRSEAERKERRERKRRQAEANGLVPLEITATNDDDSDSSPSNTPPGASTPNPRSGDQPTTDPLRIYKRCCQLRETTALDRVKEQISKPSATLAEAPGTVAIIDLSGTEIPLADVITLGDWLAVVPVRKLILDDCSLTDESLRIILSGLAGCKSAEQAKQNKKLPRGGNGKKGQEQLGVIEKISLKNNPEITKLGWKHIALFLHISRSLRAIDLSGIPFPKRPTELSPGDLSRTTTASSNASNNFSNSVGAKPNDIGSLFTRAISERFAGDKLEELILSRCRLATGNISDLVDTAIKCKVRRLGLADNGITPEGLTHVVRYVKSGICEGLDLGGNDLHNSGHLVAEAVDEQNPLFAISWANCNLATNDLELILTPLTKLKNFKFMDLSRNPALFSGLSNAVQLFRKFLPRLKSLKRLHLCDVEMTSEQVIALSEVFPDCSGLAHISILDNAPLIKAMNSTENDAQEEACAFLASLMTAVRVSHTIVAVELEVPSADSSEVIRALASQIVAYSLRNMEHGALDEFGVPSGNVVPDKDAPEVLLHIVGHMDGYDENHDDDEPAPDDDYMIASTGIVKALGVCLGTQDHHSRTASRNISPSASGAATPRQGPLRALTHKKPKDVSLELCESARKIRMRLRPALLKEDRAGNTMNYRRLLGLDQTLERIIQRFEEEYPATKVPQLPASLPSTNGLTSIGSSPADASLLSASVESNGLTKIPTTDDSVDQTPLETGDPFSVKLSRTSSNTSLAAKALTYEEGRMLRFGQSMRRDLLKPTGTDDYEHGTSVNDPPEPEHLAALRDRLEQLKGEEIRQKVEADGPDNVLRELGVNAEELMALQKDDPEGFKAFRQSQLAAQINAGIISDPRNVEEGEGS